MTDQLVLRDLDSRGVARLTLNRADVHNAFNEELIAVLTAALVDLEADPAVRVVVLAARGKSFSAGADLNWMKRMAGYAEEDNLADARRLAQLMYRLDRLAKPTVALVQGASYGGGVGLVACCDIALAAENAVFSLSEVRLGLIPSVISPYVIAAMGAGAARRYFLTAETFSAREAERIGLVQGVVPAEQLESRGDALLKDLLKCSPAAQAAAKRLIFTIAGQTIEAELIEETARYIAEVRASDEGKEGVAAFLEKRKPAWLAD